LQATNLGDRSDEVNSYHNFSLAHCPPGFVVTARAEDKTIEAIRHTILPWEGWMWHPEREPQFNTTDVMRFRALLDSRSPH
jgi:putative glutamine amidotransferase